MTYGWEHPATAERYEQFCERHDRYRTANAEIIAHAAIEPGQRVLDLAAGTGRTAEGALAAGARVVCWEPASAMRAVGMRRASGAEWPTALPENLFDRVLCGAAAWQWQPFADFAALAAARLREGGALVFNMPSLYLGIPDEPGGGADPLLLEFLSRLAQGAVPKAPPAVAALSPASIDAALTDAGLEPHRWMFRVAITEACLADWRRIPVLTDALLAGLDLAARDERIDRAVRETDSGSWKWEGWMGWTAWKR